RRDRRWNLAGSAGCAHHRIDGREVLEPDEFELWTDDCFAAVEIVGVIHGLRRPEAFGYGEVAGPDPAVDVLRGNDLGPHAAFAAEYVFLLLGRERRVRRNGISRVESRGWEHRVEVVGLRKEHVVSALRALIESGGTAPGLHDDVFWQAGSQNLIPAD